MTLGVVRMNACMEQKHYHIISPFENGGYHESIKLDNVSLIDTTSLSDDLHIINVTSDTLEKTKSHTAYMLALDYANKGYKTLFLDMDLRKTKSSSWVKEKSCVDVFAIIKEGIPVEDVCYKEVPNLDIICSENIHTGITEFLISRAFKQFIYGLKNTYDKILIDAPSLLHHKEALILRDYACGTIIVHDRLKR